ncbi:unnamed protein product [Closterium sp. NIES-65]|nr:unnamed protein product [Closterium sp. NIES-65]
MPDQDRGDGRRQLEDRGAAFGFARSGHDRCLRECWDEGKRKDGVGSCTLCFLREQHVRWRIKGSLPSLSPPFCISCTAVCRPRPPPLIHPLTAARFDFSVNDQENHQETYDNLREAMKKTHRMCAVVYDTHGPEITIFNSNNATVTMTAGSTVVLSGDKDQPVTANALPLACPELAKCLSITIVLSSPSVFFSPCHLPNREAKHMSLHSLIPAPVSRAPPCSLQALKPADEVFEERYLSQAARPPASTCSQSLTSTHTTSRHPRLYPPQAVKPAVKPGDEVFVGRYLFTGSETTSVWLKVEEVKGDDIVCTVTNTAELQGEFFTVHAAQVQPVPILCSALLCSAAHNHSHPSLSLDSSHKGWARTGMLLAF